MSNILGNGIVNKYWNITSFYYKDHSIQQCNKYKYFYLSIDGKPYSFGTDIEVKDFIDNIKN